MTKHPSVLAKVSEALEISFSPRFYLRNYAKYAVWQRGPLQHYVKEGEAVGYLPVAYFDPTWWRSTHGLDEGEFSTVFENFLKLHTDRAPSQEYDVIKRACFRDDDELCRVKAESGKSRNGLLDLGFISAQNTQRAAAPDEICLYLRLFGEGYTVAPSRLFDPGYYLLNNEDVSAAGVDPFLHFLTKGLFEDRKPSPFLKARADWSRYSDDPSFLQSVYSPAELFELDGQFELTRGDFTSIGSSVIINYPANLFFGEPHLRGAAEIDLMLDVYAAYMEAHT